MTDAGIYDRLDAHIALTTPSVTTDDRSSSDSVDLSVLFVTRNEEEHIGECISTTMESVEEARRAGIVSSVEFILVDSASTDRTVDVAAKFPIRIVFLDPSWPLSCGAGCYVGLQHVKGTFTAIVNGDLVIDPRWLARTLPYFVAGVGGVCGVATEHLPGRTVVERILGQFSAAPLSLGHLPPEVESYPGGYSTGTLLLRTDAAMQVGSYNPFFRAAEDMDLRLRLVRAGWTVLNVPVHQGTHFWAARNESVDARVLLRTLLRNSIGLGQMARYSQSRDAWIARRAAQPCFNARNLQGVLVGLSLAALLCCNFLALLGAPEWAIVAILGDAGLALAVALGRRRARMLVPEFLFAWVLSPPLVAVARALGFLRGFLMRPREPREYPQGARAVKS